MTLFEYLSAAHTLILTFALTRALSGAADAIRPGRRYWVHLSWLGLGVAFCLFAFWALWSYVAVEWTINRFIGLLAVPALIYVYSSIVIPSDPSSVESWRKYYFEKRLPLFGTGVLLMAAIIYSNQFILGVAPMQSSQVTLYGALAMFSIGLFATSPRLHAVLAIGPVIFFTLTLLEFAHPGSMAQ
jgi:dolichyl-phosphate-mannose--protein O-mannosyl transferase